jgi:hypothetical protein
VLGDGLKLSVWQGWPELTLVGYPEKAEERVRGHALHPDAAGVGHQGDVASFALVDDICQGLVVPVGTGPIRGEGEPEPRQKLPQPLHWVVDPERPDAIWAESTVGLLPDGAGRNEDVRPGRLQFAQLAAVVQEDGAGLDRGFRGEANVEAAPWGANDLSLKRESRIPRELLRHVQEVDVDARLFVSAEADVGPGPLGPPALDGLRVGGGIVEAVRGEGVLAGGRTVDTPRALADALDVRPPEW